MSQRDPIRVFVTHCFEESDDYVRVFEYLESARNFYYRNCGNLAMTDIGRSQDAVREELRRQINGAEVVIALSSLYTQQQDLLVFELNYSKASDKPVILLPLFGREQPALKTLEGLIDESVAWDERALVDAVKRQARHEETTRWDTIEFKLD
ncbi:MAG: TIR domain-containing protein [Steroidobacteraceae bacterium]